MRISGDSINTFDIFITKYKIKYIAGLKWIPVSDNSWKSVDRYNESDQYLCTFEVVAIESVIDEFLTEIEANRQDSNELTLSNFNISEKIFGANIDYSNNLLCTVTKINPKKQKEIGIYSISVTIKLIMDKDTSGLFNAGSSLPELLIFTGYDIKTNRTVTHLMTYNDDMFYADENADSGVLSIEVIFDSDQMSDFRNYIRNVRGDAFSLPAIGGISKPFGIGTSYPISVKCKKFQEEQLDDVNFWKVKIEFVQDF